MGTLNSFILTSAGGIGGEKPSSSYSGRIACEMMRASDLLAVTDLCTHTNLNKTTRLFQKESI